MQQWRLLFRSERCDKLRRPPSLGAITAEVLNRNRVPPGDVSNGDIESCRESLSLGRTWCVLTVDDRFHDFRVDARCGNKFVEADSLLFDKKCERLHG